MNFDYLAGSKTTVPFKCRVGSYYLQSANNGEGDFFLDRPAFMRYLFNNPPGSVQDVYKVESISYSKIASGHLDRTAVVLVLVGAIGGYL